MTDLAELEARRDALRYQKMIAENGNNFAESFGILRDLRKQLWVIEDQIERLKEKEEEHVAAE